jgi:hypothetical protein
MKRKYALSSAAHIRASCEKIMPFKAKQGELESVPRRILIFYHCTTVARLINRL